MCLQEGTRDIKGNRGALVTISGNVDKSSITTRMSVIGCDICRVPLCSNEYCWDRWHREGGLQKRRLVNDKLPIDKIDRLIAIVIASLSHRS
jgi:hypothetical protein